jgi:hypothetical protein
MKLKYLIAILFLLMTNWLAANKAYAYILVPPNCRTDALKCLKAGEMEYIFVFGEIQYTDASFFRNLDDNWPQMIQLPTIWLESEGGHVHAATEIGRILRKWHAISATGNPITKVDEYTCNSACVFIAAGAVERHLKEIGLHSSYIIENKHKKNETLKPDSVQGIASIKSYLEEMGINSLITDIMFNIPPEKIEELVFDENGDDDQQIIKLGFHMPLTERFPDDGFSKAKKHPFMSDDEELEFAALNGDIWAAIELADYYTRETATRLPSPILERKWLQFAVDHGNVHAMHRIKFIGTKNLI